jgi:ribosomal protein S18 acetylase RimI-like enzyme
VSEADPAALRQAAAWLRSMDEDYYRLFGISDAAVEALLADLLRDPASEFGTHTFFRHEGSLAGLVCAFPAEEMFARRLVVLKALTAASIRMLPADAAAEARGRLRQFAGAPRKLPPDGYYLAKLYVAAQLRGSGLADRLMACFLDAAAAAGRQPCLHVRTDNAAALALYRRHGFAVAPDDTMSSATYSLMVATKRVAPSRPVQP